MDGLSAVLTSASTDLSQAEASGAVQVKVLKEAMDQAASQILPLLEGVGQNVDVTA